MNVATANVIISLIETPVLSLFLSLTQFALMQELNAWLTGTRDFGRGAELYLKYGQSNFFKELLSAGPTPYNTKKLGEELEALAPSSPAIEPPQKEIIQAVQPVAEKSKLSLTQKSNDHAIYIGLCTRRDEVVRQLDRNMAALEFTSNQTVLFETAKQILRLHQQKQEIWTKIDHYQEHQSFEPEKEIPVKSREEKMQLIYQSLSKARKRLADPKYLDKERTQKLIVKKLADLEKLKGGNE